MKRLVVLGGGESGVGTALLGKEKGFEVFVSDYGKLKEEYKDVLIHNEIEWEEGTHTSSKILNADGSLQLSCKRSFPTIKSAIPKILGLDKLFPNSKWFGRYNLTFLDPDKNHVVDAIS